MAAHALSLVAESRGYSLPVVEAQASHCSGFSYGRVQVPGPAGSVLVVHGLSCSAARGIFLDQRWNPCSLHWQADY